MPRLEISRIQNLTTGIDIYSTALAQPLEVVEWGEQTLVFQSTARALTGHLVSVAAVILFGAERRAFEATGKVQSLATGTDGLTRFEILLQQFDRQLWSQFLEALKAKQSRADRIFKSVRGEER